MSTIPEVLVAHHCGFSVFPYFLITNECIPEEDADEKDRLLETLTNQDIEKEVAHINTDKLADETFTERLLRFVCYVMIAFGFFGGLISFLFTFTTIFDDFSG